MKNFIIATLIFIAVAVCGILLDALFLDIAWGAMPNLLYYALGWLASGIYVYAKQKKAKDESTKKET